MSVIRFVVCLCVLIVASRGSGAQQTPLPTNPHGALPAGMDCSDCHTSADWKRLRPDPRFDHARATRFALTGSHATVTCARCHLDLRFDEPKVELSQCASCHVDVHRGNLGQDCTRCHNTSEFRDVEALTLHQRTAFPLTGAHLNTPCESCHKTERAGVFAAVPRDCIACHQTALSQAASSGVDHTGFPRDCTQCHVTLTWSGGTQFDHVSASQGYVLEGAHSIQRCASCHTTPGFGLRFAPPPTSNQDCVACHQSDYTRVHGGQGYPTTCVDCHNASSWDADFNHAAVAGGFALQGAHQSRSCIACHQQPGNALRWSPPPSGNADCVACHLADWQREHAVDLFPQTCTSCHTQNNWSSTFNHDATEFPINSGAHRGQWTNCATCHTTPGDYKVFTCLSCHVHNRTTMDDKHREQSGYSYDSQRCYSCHRGGRG